MLSTTDPEAAQNPYHAATPETRLLLDGFRTDSPTTVHLQNGGVYSVNEVRDWLSDTGGSLSDTKPWRVCKAWS